MFPTSGLARRLPCLLPATKTVMAIGRRPCGQHSECFSTGCASTAANPDPIVLLVVRLFASPPVTDDSVVTAERTWARQQPQRDCRHPGSALSFASGSAIKRINGWREGPRLPSLPGFHLGAGLHPPVKSVSNEKRITSSTAGRYPSFSRFGRYKRVNHSLPGRREGRTKPQQLLASARTTPIAAGTPVRQGGEWSAPAQVVFR